MVPDGDKWRALMNMATKLPGFIKCREILDTLGNYYLLNMVNAS